MATETAVWMVFLSQGCPTCICMAKVVRLPFLPNGPGFKRRSGFQARTCYMTGWLLPTFVEIVASLADLGGMACV